MKKEMLYEVFGDINEQYIAEAHGNKRQQMSPIWMKWAAVAASLVLVFMISIPMIKQLTPKVDEEIPGIEKLQGIKENHTLADLEAEFQNKAEVDDDKGDNILVINEVDGLVSADMDVEYTFYQKLPQHVWMNILEEFQAFTGISYENFVARVAEPWEVIQFYSRSVRGYKDGWAEEEYRLHDYVFACATANGGSATIALCTLEAPLREYFFECDNPKQSEINGVPLIIYEYENLYMVQFSYGNVNYDMEAGNITLEDLEHLLSNILTTTDTTQNSLEDDISENIIEDVPADGSGNYMETIDSNDLTKETADFFGGSYLDESGRFVVVLTEDTAENRAAICKELGIRESSTVFKQGDYTLAYLTELQAKISDAMIKKELPFVISSSVSETSNRIKVCITTNEEALLAKLYALDTIGGAIEVEYSSGAATIDLLVETLEVSR